MLTEYQNEYLWLSCIATTIIIVVFCIIISHLFKNGTLAITIKLLMLFGCSIYSIISVQLTLAMREHLSLNWKQWDNKNKEHLRYFLKYAIETKYNTTAEKIIKDIEEIGETIAGEIKEKYGEEFYKKIVHDEKNEKEDVCYDVKMLLTDS